MSDINDLRRAEDRLANEIIGLETRFDRHLEIYANNGIALKALTVVIHTMQASVENLAEQSASQSVKVNSMHSKYMDDDAVERATKRWQENVVTWGRVLTAIAVIGASVAFLLEVLK